MTTVIKRVGAMALAAALVLVAIWYLALFRPETQKLAAAHQAHAAAEQKISSLQGEVFSLQVLKKQVPSDTAKLAVLKASIPPNPELDSTLTQLQAVATASGATLSSVGPSDPTGTTAGGTPLSGLPSITLSMVASGSYSQLRSFLSDLQTMPRTVVVDAVNISGTGSSLTATLTAHIFYSQSQNS